MSTDRSRGFHWTALVLIGGVVLCLALPRIAIAGYHDANGEDECDDLQAIPVTEAVDFESQIQPIFNNPCTTCHFPGGPAQAGGSALDLRAGHSYDQLVGVNSDQNPSLVRVQPFDVHASLLFAKVNCDNPPVGTRMPQGMQPLSTQQQALIRDWIAQGALAEPAGDPDPEGQPINFGMTGSWFEPETAGQGFVFDVVPGFDPPLIIAYWYTYAGEAGGPEGQRWFFADGNYEPGDHIVTLTVLQFTGGAFDMRPPDPEDVPIGEAVLEFHSCVEATITYDLNLDNDEDQRVTGAIPIQRLSPDVMCEELSAQE